MSRALSPTAILLRPRSFHDDVAQQIRDRIGEGLYLPGSVVPELALSAELGISRTPVREALKVLAAEGLIDLVPRRGGIVRTLSAKDIRSLTVVLARLEGLAGELACEHVDDEALAEIVFLHDRMMRQYRAGLRTDYFRTNIMIHGRIVAAAGNSYLEASWATYTGQLRRIRFLSNMTDSDWLRSTKEHEAILGALTARNGRELGRILEAHVGATWPTVVAAVGKEKAVGLTAEANVARKRKKSSIRSSALTA